MFLSDNTNIEVLPAGYGDCIFMSIHKMNMVFNILVDGGLASTYYNVKERRNPMGPLRALLAHLKEKGHYIDLLICTHVDDDHIGGIRKWFEMDFPTDDFVREIWINDDVQIADRHDLNNTSAHAASIIGKLKEQHIQYQNSIVTGFSKKNEFCRINVLAPSSEHHNVIAHDIHESLDNTSSEKENNKKTFMELVQEDWNMKDNTAENEASIAFELECWDGVKLLLLGDANYQDYMEGLKLFHPDKEEKLEYNIVKLSHHGSKNNFHPDFLKRIHTPYYIVSTNGGKFKHPDKEVLAQIICNTDSIILFNYKKRMQELILEQDRLDFPYLDTRIKALN